MGPWGEMRALIGNLTRSLAQKANRSVQTSMACKQELLFCILKACCKRGIEPSIDAGGTCKRDEANQAHPCLLNEAPVRTSAIAMQANAIAIVELCSTTSTTLQEENACKAKDRRNDHKLETHCECMP